MAHYIHDEKNNRIEGLSKEEIYALIDEVIASGELPTDTQTAFVTALKSIVDGNAYKIGFCTQAQYNQLEAQGELEANALYIITDDTTYDELVTYIDNKANDLASDIAALQTEKKDKETIAHCTESSGTITCDFDFMNSLPSDWPNVILSFNGNFIYYNSFRVLLGGIFELTYANEKYRFKINIDATNGVTITYEDTAQHLYRHNIEIYVGPSYAAYFSIITNSQTAITNSTLSNYISKISATGYYKATPSTDGVAIINIYINNNTWYVTTVLNVSQEITLTSSNLTDTVTQIL